MRAKLSWPEPVRPATLRLTGATRVRVDGRTLLFFGGSNYLGLTWHPSVRRALAGAARMAPLHPNGSRITTGEHELYPALEADLARFFRTEAAVLLASGYLAPIAACQGMAGGITHVLIDESAHPCVADGARLTGRPVATFPPGDFDRLARLVARLPRSARVMIATDGTYGLRGGVAPLDRYLAVLPATGRLLVDDAHGAGSVGPDGRGGVALLRLRDRRIVQTISLAKAIGGAGGAVLGGRECITAIRANSTAFGGSTCMPLGAVAATRVGLRVLAGSPARVRRLQANVRRLQAGLPARSEICGDARTPVTGLYPTGPAQARALHAALLAAGILPPWIRYVRGPAEGFFRFAVSSEHSVEQIDRLAEAINAGLAADGSHF